MAKRFLLVMGLLTTFVANSMAMSLGATRGAATIGRPLDLSVPAVLGADDRSTDLADLCLEVDVSYGERRLPRSRVQVSVDKPGVSGQELVIRIRAPEVVDEPFVNLDLRMGCQQKLQRQYVVLADLAPEPARLPAAPLTDGMARIVPVLPPQSLLELQASTPPGLFESPARSAPMRASAPAPSRAAVAATAPSVTPAPTTARSATRSQPRQAAPREVQAKSGRARLSLEPVEPPVAAEPMALLKLSPDMASVLSANPVEREAAAALWRGLGPDPADTLKNAEKLRSLEVAVQALQAQAAKDAQSIQQLSEQLNQSRVERYVFAGMSLLLVMILAYSVWLKGRTQDTPWWRSRTAKPMQAEALLIDDEEVPVVMADGPEPVAQVLRWPSRAEADPGPVPPPVSAPFAASAQPQPALPKAQRGTPVDIDLDVSTGFSPTVPVPLMAWNPPHAIEPRPEPPQAEELFDVQQKADFFVSLGRPDHAVETLRSHLSPDLYSNPQGYLELFALYHGLGRGDDYEALRKTFKLRFDADVSPFALYDAPAMAEQIERISQTVRLPRVKQEETLPDAPAQAVASDLSLLDFDLAPLPEAPSKLVAPEAKSAEPPEAKNTKPTEPSQPKLPQPDDNFFAQSDSKWN